MGSAHAATYDWDGDTNSNFTNGSNWVGGSWDQWSDYTFGAAATSGSVNINSEFGMNSLILQSGLAHDIVIGSDVPQPLIMGINVVGNPSALISIDTDSKNLTINSQYISASAVTWDVGANRTLTLNGQLNNWFNSASLVKNGAGTAVLTNNNGYTGDTTINGGTLQIGNGGTTGSLYSPSVSGGNLTFGSTGSIVNNSTLVYDIAGGSVNVNKTISGTGTLSVTGNQSVNFAAGTAITTAGSQTYSATATGTRYYGFNLSDDATVTLTSTAGNISMTGMLGTANGNTGNLIIDTSAGNGNVTLNTPAGVPNVDYGLNSLTVTAGTGTITLGTHNAQDWYNITTLSLTGGAINSTANMVQFATLTVNNSSASAFSGNLTASGGALVKEGAGILTLSGDNSYSGGTTINEGTLVAIRGRLGTGPVVINDGGTLLANDQWVLNSTNPYGVTERNIGSLTINTGGTLQLDNTNGFVNGVANLYLNGGSVTGGPNDLRGDLFLYNGNQQITAGGTTTSTIASVIGVTGNTNTINVDTGSTLNVTAGIKNSDWNNNGSTPGGIIKAGTGTLVLSGSSTYSGGTTVNGGVLSLAGASALPTTGAVEIAAGATVSNDAAAGTSFNLGALTLNGGELAATATPASDLGNFHLKGDVTVGGATMSIISADVRVIQDDNRNFNVADVDNGSGVDLLISGKIGHYNNNSWGYATKSGDGTMKLGGVNELGGMTVNAGRLILEDTAIGWTFPVTGLTNHSQLEFSVTSGSRSYTAALGGTGALFKTGIGTMTLSGVLSYTGTSTVADGTLNLQGSGGGGTDYNAGNININGASTLRVSGLRYNFGGEAFTFDSVGGGTIDALASGAGGMVFTGNNTFATSGGAQNIISGTRIANEGFNLNGQTATFNVAIGTDATSDLKVTGTLWNGGHVVKDGAGRMEISSDQQYSGTTTVTGGTLIVNGSIASSSLTTVQTGATLGGSGAVGALTVQSGGTHNAGNSPGIQTVTSTTYESGSIFAWDLDGNTTTQSGTAPYVFDQVTVTGALDIQSGAIFRVIQNAGLDFENGFWDSTQTWSNIFSAGTLTSGWASNTAVSVYNTSNVLQDVSSYGSFTITGTSLTWTAVPEPTSALAGLLLGAGMLRRRRRA